MQHHHEPALEEGTRELPYKRILLGTIMLLLVVLLICVFFFFQADRGAGAQGQATQPPVPTLSPEHSALPSPTPTPSATPTYPPGTGKLIALTFDDGPGHLSTERILDLLDRYSVKATFFLLGKQIELHPNTVRRAHQAGHQLGNHTYDHKNLTKLTPDGMIQEVDKVNQSLNTLIGRGAPFVRPPYGAVNKQVLSTLPFPLICWSLDTLDWKTRDAQKTIDAVLNNVRDGDIILMHDIYQTTADAVETILPALLERGFEFVTVDELFARRNIKLKPGSSYRYARPKR